MVERADAAFVRCFLMFYGVSEEKMIYLCRHNEVCKRSLREKLDGKPEWAGCLDMRNRNR